MFDRLCSRLAKPKAVTTAAHELARLICAMPTKGQESTDHGQAYYEERYRGSACCTTSIGARSSSA